MGGAAALTGDGFRFYTNLASREQLLSREDEFDLGARINNAYANLLCLVLGTPTGTKQWEDVGRKLSEIDQKKENLIFRYNRKSYVTSVPEIDQYQQVQDYYELNPWGIEEVTNPNYLRLHAESLAEIIAGKNKNHLEDWIIAPVEEGLEKYRKEMWEKYRILAEPYKQEINAEKRRFVGANLRLVMDIAKSYVNRGGEFLDLVSEGNTGLMHAIGMFDYTRGTKFSTFATNHIKANMGRKMRENRMIRIPNDMISLIGRIKKESASFREKQGYYPSTAELAKLMEKSEKTILRVMQLSDKPLSLDEERGDGDDDDRTLYNFIEDTSIPSPLESTIANRDGVMIRQLISRLKPRQQQIIMMRFGIGYDQNYTLEEIGEKIGLTRERIRQIEEKALDKLRWFALRKDFSKPITATMVRSEDHSTPELPIDLLEPKDRPLQEYERYRHRFFRSSEVHLQQFLEAQMEDHPHLMNYVEKAKRMERLIGREITDAFREIWFDFSELLGEVMNSSDGITFLTEAIEQLGKIEGSKRQRVIYLEEIRKYQQLLKKIESPESTNTLELPSGYDFKKVFASILEREGTEYSYASTFFPVVYALRRDLFEKEVITPVVQKLRESEGRSERLERMERLQRSIARNERLISEGYQKPLLRHAVIVASHLEKDLEECIQAGNRGLNQKIKRYSLFSTRPFSQDAFYAVKTAIYVEILREKKVELRDPRQHYSLINRISVAANQLLSLENLTPTAELLAERTGFNLKYIQKLRTLWDEDLESSLEVLEEEETWADEEGLKEYSSLAPSLEEYSDSENLLLKEVMSLLKPRTQEILKLRFGIGYDQSYTLEEVGEKIGLTRERIRQIEAKALKEISRRLSREMT